MSSFWAHWGEWPYIHWNFLMLSNPFLQLLDSLPGQRWVRTKDKLNFDGRLHHEMEMVWKNDKNEWISEIFHERGATLNGISGKRSHGKGGNDHYLYDSDLRAEMVEKPDNTKFMEKIEAWFKKDSAESKAGLSESMGKLLLLSQDNFSCNIFVNLQLPMALLGFFETTLHFHYMTKIVFRTPAFLSCLDNSDCGSLNNRPFNFFCPK
jgi:hypothetical protein